MHRPNQLVKTGSLEWTDHTPQGRRAILIGLAWRELSGPFISPLPNPAPGAPEGMHSGKD